MNEMNKSNILREIMNLAKAELNKNGSIGYTMPDGKHHIFIYVDDSIQYADNEKTVEDGFYVIEPNRVVAGAHEPMGDTTAADYNDFAELLVGCMWCIEQFEQEHERNVNEIKSSKSNYEFIKNQIKQEYMSGDVELASIVSSAVTGLSVEDTFKLYAELRQEIDGDKTLYLMSSGEVFDIGAGERLNEAELKDILSEHISEENKFMIDLGFANLVAQTGTPGMNSIFLCLEDKDGVLLQGLGTVGQEFEYAGEDGDLVFLDKIYFEVFSGNGKEEEISLDMKTWICVYKDILGFPDEQDNLTYIGLPTRWFLDALKDEGISTEEWRDFSTADTMENIARNALKDGVILDCTDRKIKRKLLLENKPSLDSLIESAAPKQSNSVSKSNEYNR